MPVISFNNGRNHVYHKPCCPYALRIKVGNRMNLDVKDLKHMGYRPCKYCSGVKFTLKEEVKGAQKFLISNDIHYLFSDTGEELYLKTDISFWRISYSVRRDGFVLYHGNFAPGDKQLIELLSPRQYHFQQDEPACGGIKKHLQYIVSHDRYIRMVNGEKVDLPCRTKREKKLAQKTRRSINRRRARNVMSALAELERANPELKQLSLANNEYNCIKPRKGKR